MFSKLKNTSKNEIRSVFRNIFHMNDDPNFETKRKTTIGKSSISKRFKARLSSFRMSKRKTEFNINNDGVYNKITSPHLDLTVSSILKKSSSCKTLKNRKIRFSDDDNSDTSETLVIKENDVAYYKQMKEELIDRNREFQRDSAIKRKASNAADVQAREKIKKLDECTYYNPADSTNHATSNDDKNLLDINGKFGICTYFIEPDKNPWNSPTVIEKPLRITKPDPALYIDLKLWPSENDDIFIEELSSSSLNTVMSGSNSAFDEIAQFGSYPDDHEDKYQNKIVPVKKYQKHRFNPISKNTSCSVAYLSKQKSSIEHMSWCSS